MGNVLIVGEHSEGKLKKSALSAITFGKQVAAKAGNSQVHLLLVGTGLAAVAEQARGSGVSAIHLAEHAGLAHYINDNWAPVVAQAAKSLGASVVAAAASTMTKDLLPKVCAVLEGAMVSEALAVVDATTFKRPMWAGNATGVVQVKAPVVVATVRATEFDPAPAGGAPCEVKTVAVTMPASCATCFVTFDAVKNVRPDLAEAAIVVSGGRGCKQEGLKLVEGLADQLHAAVGWTRAVVDAGWAPNDLQVGQTGKIVAPNLYLAIGLSGAIQHLAGMKGSKTIVAINKDPEAPIFTVADYGLVADLFKAVPEMQAEIKKQKGA